LCDDFVLVRVETISGVSEWLKPGGGGAARSKKRSKRKLCTSSVGHSGAQGNYLFKMSIETWHFPNTSSDLFSSSVSHKGTQGDSGRSIKFVLWVTVVFTMIREAASNVFSSSLSHSGTRGDWGSSISPGLVLISTGTSINLT
jgi:hypothetical protein